MKRSVYLLLVIVWSGSILVGQERKVEKDSTERDSTVHYKETRKDSIAKDSLDVYKSLKDFSKKSKIGEWFNKYILVDSSDYFKTAETESKKDSSSRLINKQSGKIIRKITIESYDPFGYSLEDTTQKPHSWFQKTGNSVHIKSLPMAINKFLLQSKNEALDTLLWHESERLLRAQSYVRRLKFVPEPVEGSKDSVDIVVKVLDSWSMIPKIQISGSHLNLGLLERNFVGTGHRVNLRYGRYFTDGNNEYEALYQIPNIRNTFVDFSTKYLRDHDHYYDKYATLGRRFFSPTTKWGGGLFFQDRLTYRPFPGDSVDFEYKDLKFLHQDYWLGHAFVLARPTAKRNYYRNLTLTGRALFINYKEHPSQRFDSIQHFSNERFFLSEIGVNSRRYVQDKYIFKDGDIEDVPVGSLYSITGGVQHKNDKNRLYAGFRASYASYFKWGFWSGNLEAGSFFDGGVTQSAISLKVSYFSKLWEFGDWKMRQFVKPQLVIGFNRKNTILDRVGLNDEVYYKGIHSSEYLDYDNHDRYINYQTGSIKGFASEAVGTRKYVLELQTQLYSPWSLWGFHFNPYMDITMGYLQGSKKSFASNSVYSAFSLGVIIRNDFLVFDAFQLSLTYFPKMPGIEGTTFKSNAFNTHDFGFQNLETTAPRPVIYQ